MGHKLFTDMICQVSVYGMQVMRCESLAVKSHQRRLLALSSANLSLSTRSPGGTSSTTCPYMELHGYLFEHLHCDLLEKKNTKPVVFILIVQILRPRLNVIDLNETNDTWMKTWDHSKRGKILSSAIHKNISSHAN